MLDHRPLGISERNRRADRAYGFTLIELLTVVFIIGLLIAILIPSIAAARRSAKNAVTKSTLRVITGALEMFKNDQGKDFQRTNGYPPSFSHPRIGTTFDPVKGQFPFLPTGNTPKMPTVYGAHWLPAMLMGVDRNGYVPRSSVPRPLRTSPSFWYADDPGLGKPIDRAPLYLDPGATRTLATEDIRGTPPDPLATAYPEWNDIVRLPVLVDAFDQPVLYYAANKYGKPTNMVADIHNLNNEYKGGIQQKGQPYYFHQDNIGFTGSDVVKGWNFGGALLKTATERVHKIAISGAELNPQQIVQGTDNFATYIADRQMSSDLATKLAGGGLAERALSMRPVNSDTYLLITPGPDGRYGTPDDISNLPAAVQP